MQSTPYRLYLVRPTSCTRCMTGRPARKSIESKGLQLARDQSRDISRRSEANKYTRTTVLNDTQDQRSKLSATERKTRFDWVAAIRFLKKGEGSLALTQQDRTGLTLK